MMPAAAGMREVCQPPPPPNRPWHSVLMTTTMTFDAHLAALTGAAERLARDAGAADRAAPVPCCPDWTLADLLAHISLVHRWAACHLRGENEEELAREPEILQEADPMGYYRDGWKGLVRTLQTVPQDTEAMVFLRDAPRPREFWARRQAHETTIHAVDALAAQLGRSPAARELELDVAFAVDGIDELVCGFVPRRRSRWSERFSCAIRPSDSDRRWTITVDPETVRCTGEDSAHPDVVLRGTASQLYLGLWNRGSEIQQDGPIDVLSRWRELQRVRWTS